ncbi:MAG: cytidine deaminase [Acidobacteria bacterium]|nr:MAG: cytidine deaminase [Acidobacteriota bacterium]
MTQVTDADLIAAAQKAREQAFAPYSHFKVGAALLTASGEVFTGCNIESASYGLTVCAERVAVFKAVSQGARQFVKIAIVADTDQLTPPCGACRQVLWELCGDVPVLLANPQGAVASYQMRELYPHPFDKRYV